MNKDEMNEQTTQPEAEAALTDAHNPDLGTPETPADAVVAVDETDKLKQEAGEWKDKYMRLYAEFDNFRKRSMKERSDLLSTASSDVIKEMLPILDDFDRAVKANESVEDIGIIREGFVLIHQKLYKRLESKGLKPLDANGKTFDTDFHEAITQIPAPSPDMVGKVVDEVEKGYMLNDKVIRFSKVVIGQ
ncbi:MAG: nucleotide exchange factor GrpE [Flavobacteriales bacterium]|nr:nucleotide exchange factor GrpE [Flavobacteriales bacterium]